MQSSASADGQAALRLSFNPPPVTVEPSAIVERRHCGWPGLHVETVTATERTRLDCHYNSSWHLLIAAHRGERIDGESAIEGGPRSSLRNFSGLLTFVPAGHAFRGWQTPRVLTEITCVYIDPNGPFFDQEALEGIALKPRLFFDDGDQAVPHDLGVDLRERGVGACDHVRCPDG